MYKFSIEFDHDGIIPEHVILDRVKESIEKHNKKQREDIRELLDTSIKTKTLITLAKNQYRGAGKSTILREKARELGATLVISGGFDPRRTAYDEATIISPVTENSVRGIRLEGEKFIVDEDVKPEIIRQLILSGNEFLGGFGSLF